MDKSKIKNFILILLALVNIFLLFIVISGAKEQQKAAVYRKQALATVLNENGITLNPNIELSDKIPALLTLNRNLEIEKDRVSALIGKCTPSDQGGNIYYYKGSNGEAKFRGTGEFDIRLESGVIPKGKDPVATAKAALKKLNIECSDIEPVITTEGDNTTVVLYCSWDKTAITNAKISFIFTPYYLWMIQGNRPLDVKYTVQSTENYPDSVTVLMKFLQSVDDTGNVCSEIQDLKTVYKMYSAVSGNCTLKPIWCVQTDAGLYYIDAETGKTENIESST